MTWLLLALVTLALLAALWASRNTGRRRPTPDDRRRTAEQRLRDLQARNVRRRGLDDDEDDAA